MDPSSGQDHGHNALTFYPDHSMGADHRDLAALASLPDVVCKISNFWMPGDPPVRDEIALAFFREVVAAFGATRTITGANWPPSSLAGPYEASWDRIDRLVAAVGLDSDAARAILFDNADRIFRTPKI